MDVYLLPDGLFPMHSVLFIQEYRGKSLAKAVVLGLLIRYAQNSSELKCAPFTYIEQSNHASKSVFTALGFNKSEDKVWAELGSN